MAIVQNYTMMSVEEIRAEAKNLPPAERGQLVCTLIEDLGRPEHDVSDDEVLERIRQTEDGTVQDISHEELIAGLKYIPKD